MTSQDDMMLLGNLDQSLAMENGWVLDRIDEIINESVEKHAALIALNAGRQLIEISRISGLASAKLIYGMRKNWSMYNDVNDEFVDTVSDYMDIHKDNVLRYANVWALFAENAVPKELEEDIQNRNIKDLIPIGLAISQGYEIEQKEWDKLASAPDYNTVLQVLREDVKNKPPRKGSLQLYMDRSGSLWAFQDEKRLFAGSLEIDDEDEAVQKAINRIINGAGIIRQ